MTGKAGKTPAVPPAGAYDPHRTVGRPGGKPTTKPRFRVQLHKRDWPVWQKLIDEAGVENAQQLWDHLAHRADQPPLLGASTPLKGGHVKATPDGWSRVYHYEVSGPGRVDYRYHDNYDGGNKKDDAGRKDKHRCVRIIDISMGSH